MDHLICLLKQQITAIGQYRARGPFFYDSLMYNQNQHTVQLTYSSDLLDLLSFSITKNFNHNTSLPQTTSLISM